MAKNAVKVKILGVDETQLNPTPPPIVYETNFSSLVTEIPQEFPLAVITTSAIDAGFYVC